MLNPICVTQDDEEIGLDNLPLISTHIEKTGGTTMQWILESAFGAESVVLFNPITQSYRFATGDPRTNPYVDYIKQLISKTPLMPLFSKAYSTTQRETELVIPKNVSVIHGHFLSTRYDGEYPNSPSVVIFREPLARMFLNIFIGEGIKVLLIGEFLFLSIRI